jgi:uncharacterized protein YjaG (DUF416 family)|tara:strand:- start:404 stop:619 length:216 start_codon:yes stop_codon:yes gene_type:complete
MEQVVIALLMLVNNEIVEHRIQPSLSECLKRKRIAQRSETGTSINHQCIKSKAEIEQNIDGSWSIKKLIME